MPIKIKIQRSDDRRKGSLLLEALLAVVILSVSITLIIQSMIASLHAGAVSADYSQAMILLENKMAESLQKPSIESGLVQEGRFEAPFGKFGYALESESLEDQPNLNKVHLEVIWKNKEITKSLALETYASNRKEK